MPSLDRVLLHVAVAEGGPVLVRLIAQIASRFGVVVTQKLSAQAVPIIGALGGAVPCAQPMRLSRTASSLFIALNCGHCSRTASAGWSARTRPMLDRRGEDFSRLVQIAARMKQKSLLCDVKVAAGFFI